MRLAPGISRPIVQKKRVAGPYRMENVDWM